MAETLTIRLDTEDRAALEAAARVQGKGLSAVVVEDDELFRAEYPNTLVVPLTRDEGLAHRSFAERIEPDDDNGVEATCWALADHVTSVSLRRVNPTSSRITTAQLSTIRRCITVAVGAADI